MEKDVLVLQDICIFIVEIAGEGEYLGLKGYLKRARIQHPTSVPRWGLLNTLEKFSKVRPRSK